MNAHCVPRSAFAFMNTLDEKILKLTRTQGVNEGTRSFGFMTRSLLLGFAQKKYIYKISHIFKYKFLIAEMWQI